MCVHVSMVQKAATIHRSKLRDGPFKLNLHPRDYFQANPYRCDKPLPPAHKPLAPGQKVSPVPFKPPSPSKKVIISLCAILHHHQREMLLKYPVTLTCTFFNRLSVNVSCVRLEE